MLEPLEILEASNTLYAPKILSGKKVIITAGPTVEAIDPVRFLSNHSSGKMGYAIAQAAAEAGAEVQLISGPVALATPAGVTRTNVTSASDMLNAAMESLSDCDVFIGTAAVADYRPAQAADQKIKKDNQDAPPAIELVENPDIIAAVARHAQRPPVVIAFAAETQDVENYARKKLAKKSVDAVVANDVSRSDIGFGSDMNEILWVSAETTVPFGPASKLEVGLFLMNLLTTLDI
jgi:phosphopantothenoylcysteine decarboxylase/phosphopantothenate--cysteine ligase